MDTFKQFMNILLDKNYKIVTNENEVNSSILIAKLSLLNDVDYISSSNVGKSERNQEHYNEIMNTLINNIKHLDLKLNVDQVKLYIEGNDFQEMLIEYFSSDEFRDKPHDPSNIVKNACRILKAEIGIPFWDRAITQAYIKSTHYRDSQLADGLVKQAISDEKISRYKSRDNDHGGTHLPSDTANINSGKVTSNLPAPR